LLETLAKMTVRTDFRQKCQVFGMKTKPAEDDLAVRPKPTIKLMS
jgi:hypothetical protein